LDLKSIKFIKKVTIYEAKSAEESLFSVKINANAQNAIKSVKINENVQKSIK